MAEQRVPETSPEAPLEERRAAILERRLATEVNNLTERIGRDPALGVQVILDPVDTLSRFGLIDSDTRDLEVRLTQGSLLDLVHLRRAIETRGIGNVLAPNQQLQVRGNTVQGIGVVIDIQVCVTVCWRSVCVTVCVRGSREL